MEHYIIYNNHPSGRLSLKAPLTTLGLAFPFLMAFRGYLWHQIRYKYHKMWEHGKSESLITAATKLVMTSCPRAVQINTALGHEIDKVKLF